MTDMGMGIVVGTKTCILTRTLSTPTRVPAGLPLPMSNTTRYDSLLHILTRLRSLEHIMTHPLKYKYLGLFSCNLS